MPRLFFSVALLVGMAVPSQAQTAFINEFHTDDASSGYIDYDGDRTDDAFTDLEFVEFAFNTEADAAYGPSDIVALFYDGDGTYADYAIGPSYWTKGRRQGAYTLYSYGPFSISLALDPQNPPQGALPDGEGAIVLAWWDEANGVLHPIHAVSYGDTVSTPADSYVGALTIPPLPVDEQPAPASDTSNREIYSLGLTGLLGTTSTAGRRTAPSSSLKARRSGPLPQLRRPSPRLDQVRAPPPPRKTASDSVATSPPGDLTWTVLANTASPGRPNSNQALPVELVRFDAVASESGAVLRWATASETQNAGFYVEHAHHSQAFSEVAFVESAGPSDTLRTYRYRLRNLAVGRHRFRLRQVDLDGAITYTQPVTVQVDAPGPLNVSAPSPSPFRARTTLTLSAADAMPLTVAAFDVMGRRVATLWDGPVQANEVYTLTLSASEANLSPGVYLIRARGPDRSVTRKVVLVR